MATMFPLTPSRQPFGMVSESKLRNLQSLKNKQNAITPNSAPALKRRAPSPDLSDSENVDPNLLESFGKRKRTVLDDDVSAAKASRYSIQIVPTSARPQISLTTPRLETGNKPLIEPSSAPAAAGRSPTRGKRMGLLKPGKRFAPPSFGNKAPSLSMSAALQGTIAHKKAKKVRTIQESKPKSWFFDIFEESEEQQNYKMNEWTMTQSATILDISDDESKVHEKGDRDKENKENIDPNGVLMPTTRSMAAGIRVVAEKASKTDMIVDDSRAPLGDLNPAEFYAEGLDATSVVLVHDEVCSAEQGQVAPQPAQTDATGKAQFTFETDERLPESRHADDNIIDIGSLIALAIPIWSDPQPVEDTMEDASLLASVDGGAIEVWESESAKDEGEKDERLDEDNAFTLQEL